MDEAPTELPPVCEPADESESGQKLLQFLERRLGLPQALLHRWIRTGQIRLNGARCKPFVRVAMGDKIRLPPFAGRLAAQAHAPEPPPETASPPLPPCVGEKDDAWLLDKPAGLPSQSGTRHEDSVAARLKARFAHQFFKPVPCHRLDKDTTGLLLVGVTHKALRRVQDQFRGGKIHKEYLAWIKGRWPYDDVRLIRNFLRKEGAPGSVKTRVVDEKTPFAKEALTVVYPLRVDKNSTLLQIRLLTGRSHQIRAQMAALGFPVLGDGKYGAPVGEPLKLHSFRVILPEGEEFTAPPPWPENLLPAASPEPLCLNMNADELRKLPLVSRI